MAKLKLMLNFLELPGDGTVFEQMVREIVFSYGLHVQWSGVGSDGGRDLIARETLHGFFASQTRSWLIQCKHFAHSKRTVGLKDLDDIVTSCAQHGATGYLLVCSTQPSSALVNRLDAITANPEIPITATYWDSVTIERLLSAPRHWAVAQLFMPKSAGEWKIYATGSKNDFTVHYRGFVFDLGGRRETKFNDRPYVVAERIRTLESWNKLLPKDHMFMPRRAYHDEKRACYMWDVDYMFPEGDQPIAEQNVLESYLGDPEVLGDGQCHYWQLRMASYSTFRDDEHYDVNHDVYYDRRHYFSLMRRL